MVSITHITLNIVCSAGPQRNFRAPDVQILNVSENFQKSDSHRILGGVVKTLSNFEIVLKIKIYIKNSYGICLAKYSIINFINLKFNFYI